MVSILTDCSYMHSNNKMTEKFRNRFCEYSWRNISLTRMERALNFQVCRSMDL